MLRSRLQYVLALSVSAGCLPAAEVDDTLVLPNLPGGNGGSAGMGNNGSGGTASPPSPAPGGGMGGGGSTPPPQIPLPSQEDCAANLTREQACNLYCDVFTRACGDFPDAYTYDGATQCSLVCYDSGWGVGTISLPDSIACRCNHAFLAMLRGQTPHCFHAAEVPSMPGGCEIP